MKVERKREEERGRRVEERERGRRDGRNGKREGRKRGENICNGNCYG